MRLAYADPPYFGLCRIYDHDHPDGRCWDDLETHRLLIEHLEGFDGWALSLTSGNLRDILPLCPPDVRVAAWVKPFASWKPGVSPAYAWEPVIFKGGRRLPDSVRVTDYVSASITLRRGFTGAKPEAVAWWIMLMLGAATDDEFVDLFPGSGAVTAAWESWRDRLPLGPTEGAGLIEAFE